MKTWAVLALLSSVVLLCSAATDLEPVTCNAESSKAAARLAMHDINENHRHGYKFKLVEHSGATTMEQGDNDCAMELHLYLEETDCPYISHKHFEDCDTRSSGERAVVANCTVQITLKSGNANVDNYKCITQQAMNDTDMMRACPDCPIMLPLQSPEGLASIQEAVQKINKNTSNEHYYILKDVGRILSGYIDGIGMYYSSRFTVVETDCQFGSRIDIKACHPLPSSQAHHAYCEGYSTQGSPAGEPKCEYIPPSSHEVDNQDPATPNTDSQQGAPPDAKGRPGPSAPAVHCKGSVPNSDPAIHPICPKPIPEPKVEPTPQQP